MKTKHGVQFPDFVRKSELEVESPDGLRGFMFEGRNGSQVIFWECDAHLEIPPHTHDFDEYIVVIEGNCKEIVEGKINLLNKGDECLVPRGKLHGAIMEPNYRGIEYFGSTRFGYKK